MIELPENKMDTNNNKYSQSEATKHAFDKGEETVASLDANVIQVATVIFDETINRYIVDVPALIKEDKPMTAIALADELDSTIQSLHVTLSGFYKTLIDRLELLERHDSPALDRLKKEGFTKTMFGYSPIKTVGYYICGEGLPNDVSIESVYTKIEKQLGKTIPEEIFIKDSRLKRIIFLEIFFYLSSLRNVIESDWGLVDSMNDTQRTDRYIKKEVKLEVWRRDQGKCVECGSQEKLEYDHIIPVAKGGSNTARNIQLLCEACNRSKSDNIV
jgi:hypothetical protein